MILRRAEANTPKLIFTSDFHEIVRGDMVAPSVVLRYDPLRIVPAAEIPTLPATQRPITANCRFHPAGKEWRVEMRFPPADWMPVDNDPTGQGTMLVTRIPMPEGSDEVECWFSYIDSSGQLRWDSASGMNYWLRSAVHDIEIKKAELMLLPNDPLDSFMLEIESVPAVERMSVRWRYTALVSQPRQVYELVSGGLEGGKKKWSAPDGKFHVASNSPIAFDLVYQVRGHTFTDDNDGTWYVVFS